MSVQYMRHRGSRRLPKLTKQSAAVSLNSVASCDSNMGASEHPIANQPLAIGAEARSKAYAARTTRCWSSDFGLTGQRTYARAIRVAGGVSSAGVTHASTASVDPKAQPARCELGAGGRHSPA